MTVSTCTKKISHYTTWYEFKKDIEGKLGHALLNWCWLEVRPKAPLPWDDSHLQAALSVVATLGEQKSRTKTGKEQRTTSSTQVEEET